MADISDVSLAPPCPYLWSPGLSPLALQDQTNLTLQSETAQASEWEITHLGFQLWPGDLWQITGVSQFPDL